VMRRRLSKSADSSPTTLTEAPKNSPALAKPNQLRLYLVNKVARGTDFILTLQRYRNRVIDIYFVVSSILGDQIAYVMLLPWLFWVFNPPLGRAFLELLILGTIVGNIVKNCLALPRPPSPPVWTRKRLTDYGCPSSHSLNSMALPFFLVYHFWNNDDLYSSITYFALAALWALSVIFSRMYLGVHSPLDVTVGSSIGFLLLIFWINVHEAVDRWLVNGIHVPMVLLLLTVSIIAIHPRSSSRSIIGQSPSFRYTVALLGLLCGLAIGAWSLNETKEFVTASNISKHPILQEIPLCNITINNCPTFMTKRSCMSIARVTIGLIILEAANFIGKYITLGLVSIILYIPWISSKSDVIGSHLGKLALPHPVPLDNIDHPQFTSVKEVAEQVATYKARKYWAEFARAFSAGWSIITIPIALDLLSLQLV